MKVSGPSELRNGAIYVAVGSELGGHFQQRDYGLTKLKPDRGRKKYPFQWRKVSEMYGRQTVSLVAYHLSFCFNNNISHACLGGLVG